MVSHQQWSIRRWQRDEIDRDVPVQCTCKNSLNSIVSYTLSSLTLEKENLIESLSPTQALFSPPSPSATALSPLALDQGSSSPPPARGMRELRPCGRLQNATACDDQLCFGTKNVQNLSETCLTLTNTGLDPEGWCHCMFWLWVKHLFAFCKFSDPRPCRRAWKLPSIRPQLLSRAATHPGHWPVVMMQSQNQWLGSYQVDVDDEVILLLDHSSLSSNLPHLYWGQSSTRIIQEFNNGDETFTEVTRGRATDSWGWARAALF